MITEKTMAFSVVKQKIIKTDEILKKYVEVNDKLKKSQQAFKALKNKYDETTSVLTRIQLENERFTYNFQNLKTKFENGQKENAELQTQQLALEEKYNQQIVESQENVRKLEQELQMIQEMKLASVSTSPKSTDINKEIKYKDLKEKFKKLQNSENKKTEEITSLLHQNNDLKSEVNKLKEDHRNTKLAENKKDKQIAVLKIEQSNVLRDLNLRIEEKIQEIENLRKQNDLNKIATEKSKLKVFKPLNTVSTQTLFSDKIDEMLVKETAETSLLHQNNNLKSEVNKLKENYRNTKLAENEKDKQIAVLKIEQSNVLRNLNLRLEEKIQEIENLQKQNDLNKIATEKSKMKVVKPLNTISTQTLFTDEIDEILVKQTAEDISINDIFKEMRIPSPMSPLSNPDLDQENKIIFVDSPEFLTLSPFLPTNLKDFNTVNTETTIADIPNIIITPPTPAVNKSVDFFNAVDINKETGSKQEDIELPKESNMKRTLQKSLISLENKVSLISNNVKYMARCQRTKRRVKNQNRMVSLKKKTRKSKFIQRDGCILRALKLLKKANLNVTISNESLIPLDKVRDWLSFPPVKNEPTKIGLGLYDKTKGSNELAENFDVKEELFTPTSSRIENLTDFQPELSDLNLNSKALDNFSGGLIDSVSKQIKKNSNKNRKDANYISDSYNSETETEIERLFETPERSEEDSNKCDQFLKDNKAKICPKNVGFDDKDFPHVIPLKEKSKLKTKVKNITKICGKKNGIGSKHNKKINIKMDKNNHLVSSEEEKKITKEKKLKLFTERHENNQTVFPKNCQALSILKKTENSILNVIEEDSLEGHFKDYLTADLPFCPSLLSPIGSICASPNRKKDCSLTNSKIINFLSNEKEMCTDISLLVSNLDSEKTLNLEVSQLSDILKDATERNSGMENNEKNEKLKMSCSTPNKNNFNTKKTYSPRLGSKRKITDEILSILPIQEKEDEEDIPSCPESPILVDDFDVFASKIPKIIPLERVEEQSKVEQSETSETSLDLEKETTLETYTTVLRRSTRKSVLSTKAKYNSNKKIGFEEKKPVLNESEPIKRKRGRPRKNPINVVKKSKTDDFTETACDTFENKADANEISLEDNITKLPIEKNEIEFKALELENTNNDVPEKSNKKKIRILSNIAFRADSNVPVDLLRVNNNEPILFNNCMVQNFTNNQTNISGNVFQKNPNEVSIETKTENQVTEQKKPLGKPRRVVRKKCDLLSQIMDDMSKHKPLVKPKSPEKNKDVPDNLDDKQWRKSFYIYSKYICSGIPKEDQLKENRIDKIQITPIKDLHAVIPKKLRATMTELLKIPLENEVDIPKKFVAEFKLHNVESLIEVILQTVIKDTDEETNRKNCHAPLMTQTQRTLLGLLLCLERENVQNLTEKFLFKAEVMLFKTYCSLKIAQITAVTRLFLAVCKIKADISRMRGFVFGAFYFMDERVIPLFFNVLLSWTEVFPMQTEWHSWGLSKVIHQIIHLKSCGKKPGYNLKPLIFLLHQFYGYEKERTDCNKLFDELCNAFMVSPIGYPEMAVRLFCKNKDIKWVFKKINEFFKPFIYKISEENVNFRAAVLVLLGNVASQLKPLNDEDLKCVEDLRHFLTDLVEETSAEIIKNTVSWTIAKLPTKPAPKKKKPIRKIILKSFKNPKPNVKNKKKKKLRKKINK